MKTESIYFQRNDLKYKAAVSFLAERCFGKEMNIYSFFGSLFTAEKYHLNKYLRPITGEMYIKAASGVIPSQFYDSVTHIETFNFATMGNLTRNPDLTMFSLSDIEALEFGLSEYADFSNYDGDKKIRAETSWIKSKLGEPILFHNMLEEPAAIRYFKNLGPFRVVI